MKRFLLNISLFFAAFQMLLCAEEKVLINIKEFISEAAKNDTEFQKILIDELFLKYEKTLNLPSKDIIVAIQSQYNIILSDSDKDFENSIAVFKLFPDTGTQLKTEYESTYQTSQSEVNSKFSIQVSQALGKNAFGKITKLEDKIIGFKIAIIKYEIIETYETYLAKLIETYYNWFSAYENLKTGINSYNENLKLLENVKQREKSSIALPIDVNKINLQVLEKKENLMYLQTKYDEYKNHILEAMKYKSENDPIPQKTNSYQVEITDFEKEFQLLKETGRTFKMLDLLSEKNLNEIQKYENELLPQIDVFGGLSVEGSEHTLKDSEKYLFAGVYFEIPFKRPGTIEKAKYETSKITLEKTNITSKNFNEKLHTHLKNLYLLIEYEKKMIETCKEKIVLAEAIVNDESKNYSLGKVSLKDLIDEVNKLEENKFQMITHEIELKKLIIEWLNLTDNLIQEDNINNINNNFL